MMQFLASFVFQRFIGQSIRQQETGDLSIDFRMLCPYINVFPTK